MIGTKFGNYLIGASANIYPQSIFNNVLKYITIYQLPKVATNLQRVKIWKHGSNYRSISIFLVVVKDRQL